LAAGFWQDTDAPNREFVWARIDVPGTKDLWVVSVHLLTRDAATRNSEAVQLRDYVNQFVPAGDYLVIGGDFNTSSRTEAALSTLSSIVATGAPYPVDQAGVGGTNASRAAPYDWVLLDPDLKPLQVPVVIGANSFPAGLVVDTRVYTPLADLAPALMGDSGASMMQHMAVVVDVRLP
jgi:endonuclease/exonuclease/phosphatase family metal-dependent hydrolase